MLLVLFLFLLLLPRAHAAGCDAPPLFELGGPSCDPSRMTVECGCSECLEWDPSAGAEWYEVTRCEVSTGRCTVVGDTRWRNHPAYTDDGGGRVPAVLATEWCVGWDAPFPRTSELYDYTVRACRDSAEGPLCSLEPSNPERYAGAPYACFENGHEVACGLSAAPGGAPGSLDGDADADGAPDSVDDCPAVDNRLQRDEDRDGVGDACDLCPATADPDQRDSDGDGVGDACDLCPNVYAESPVDSDADGVGDACDVCPDLANADQRDSDGDRVGDACDVCPGTADAGQRDRDRDGVGDACDSCAATWNPGQEDGDRDGVGNACDRCVAVADADQSDADGDGVGDACDLCPSRSDPSQADRDGDAIGDACDTDDGDVYLTADSRDALARDAEPGDWDLARGSLLALRNGEGYVFDESWCGTAGSTWGDASEPAPGEAEFYLAGSGGFVAGELICP